jgi:hypothetical protein
MRPVERPLQRLLPADARFTLKHPTAIIVCKTDVGHSMSVQQVLLSKSICNEGQAAFAQLTATFYRYPTSAEITFAVRFEAHCS